MSVPDILSPEYARNPYPYYKQMRDDYPVLFHPATQSYIISRYADIEQALKNPLFSNRSYEWQVEPIHGRTIIQMEGREHATHRNLLNPAFRGRDLQQKFLPIIEKNARELIDAFKERGEVDLYSEFATHFSMNVIVDMLGLSRADQEYYRRWYDSIIALTTNVTQDAEVTAAAMQAKDEFQDHILPIIHERRANPGDDLLSTLCQAQIDGVQMTDEEIRAFSSLLLDAGGLTTDKAISNLIKNLLEHPDQLEQVRQERILIDQAFAETLRYSPPVHIITRMTTEDVEVSGTTIPANSNVMCLIGAANRDDHKYKEPDTFNIFRDDLDVKRAYGGDANHLAFGIGRHFCVGSMLARAEVAIATNLLLDEMHDIAFKDGFTPQEEGIFLRACEKLEVRFTPFKVPETL
ncbi:MAG: cytochrome P450 [Microcoleus sp. SIO2G3]|nr:cytochrome P450 [Microcoleus sp. SIO2G3]